LPHVAWLLGEEHGKCKGYQELGGQGDLRGPKGLRSLKGLDGGFIDDG